MDSLCPLPNWLIKAIASSTESTVLIAIRRSRNSSAYSESVAFSALGYHQGHWPPVHPQKLCILWPPILCRFRGAGWTGWTGVRSGFRSHCIHRAFHTLLIRQFPEPFSDHTLHRGRGCTPLVMLNHRYSAILRNKSD